MKFKYYNHGSVLNLAKIEGESVGAYIDALIINLILDQF